jgi:hypothetical protein
MSTGEIRASRRSLRTASILEDVEPGGRRSGSLVGGLGLLDEKKSEERSSTMVNKVSKSRLSRDVLKLGKDEL